MTSVLFLWSDNQTVLIFDKIIWAIFFIDVVIRIVKSEDRWNYIKKNPFDIIAAIPLDSIFQIARVARLFRLLRIIAMSKNNFKNVFNILKTNGLDRVFVFTFAMLFISTLIIKHTESSITTYGDGLWWSIVTATTVGYGDISPSTLPGRLVAIFIMMIGIGLVGMLTGSITTYFVKSHKATNPTITFIKSELDRFEELTPKEVNRIKLLVDDLEQEHSNTNINP